MSRLRIGILRMTSKSHPKQKKPRESEHRSRTTAFFGRVHANTIKVARNWRTSTSWVKETKKKKKTGSSFKHPSESFVYRLFPAFVTDKTKQLLAPRDNHLCRFMIIVNSYINQKASNKLWKMLNWYFVLWAIT